MFSQAMLQRQRNVQKRVIHVQSCCFVNQSKPIAFCRRLASLHFVYDVNYAFLFAMELGLVSDKITASVHRNIETCQANKLLLFSQTCEFLSSKLLTDDCVFRCRQSSQRTSSQKTKLYFNGFKRSWFVICDWWIPIRFVCFCVSRFVAFDHNYD